MQKKSGKVYLVGAGPGDPELLTLKAVRAIGEAGVILVDDLVNRAVLQHAAPSARIIEVGKRGGCRSTPQAFIERLMVKFARRGHVVVRLKGGDPFVFGRGGEEMLALRAAGIETEIVSGITAGIGVLARLGIPLTHRDIARGVSFVTGHTHGGAAQDWAALVRSKTTLVIYMGIANIEAIVAALLAAGLEAATPACAVERGTLPEQYQLIATLGSVVTAVREHRIGSPALLVIGEVVGLGAAVAAPETLRNAA